MFDPKNTSLFIHVDKKTWKALMDFDDLLKREPNNTLKDKWKKLLVDLGKYVIFLEKTPALIDEVGDPGPGDPSRHMP
jgi:Mor family transcriptional regulator